MRMYFLHQLPCVCSGRKCESPWFDGGLDDRGIMHSGKQMKSGVPDEAEQRAVVCVSLGTLKENIFIKGAFVEEVGSETQKYIHYQAALEMSKTQYCYLGTKTTLLGISKRFALNRSDLCRVLLSTSSGYTFDGCVVTDDPVISL